MRRLRAHYGVSAFFVMILAIALLAPGLALAKGNGTTIQEGILKYRPGHYLAGRPLTVGFDIFGYNYQAHMFKGSYANSYLGGEGLPPYDGDDVSYLAAHPEAQFKWYWPYRNDTLIMKWNDAWTANTDRDGDGLLDRHYGFSSYRGSGAWLTNHMTGVDRTGDYTYFCKIVAAPLEASLKGGYWTLDGAVIGYDIWGGFAVTLETGTGGLLYKSPSGPGFGKW